jgi:hypothetical protein
VAEIKEKGEVKASELTRKKSNKGLFGTLKGMVGDAVDAVGDMVEEQLNIDDSMMANMSKEDQKTLIAELRKQAKEKKSDVAVADSQLAVEHLTSHWAYFSVDGQSEQDWVFFPMMKVFDSTNYANYGVRRLHVLLSEAGSPFAVLRYLKHAKLSALVLMLAILGGFAFFVYRSIDTVGSFFNENDCNCFRDSPLYYLTVVVGLIIAFIKPGIVTKSALAVGIQPLSAWTDIYIFSPYLLRHGKQSVVLNLFHDFNRLVRLNKGQVPEGGLKVFKKLGKGLMNAATLGQMGHKAETHQSNWKDPLVTLYKDYYDKEPKITYESPSIPRTSFFYGYPKIKVAKALMEFVVDTPGLSHNRLDDSADDISDDAGDIFSMQTKAADSKTHASSDEKHGDSTDVIDEKKPQVAKKVTIAPMSPDKKDQPPAYPETPRAEKEEKEDAHDVKKKKKKKKKKKTKKKKKHKKNKIAPKPVSSDEGDDDALQEL